MKQTKSKIFTAADEVKRDKPLTLTGEQLRLILSAQTQEAARQVDADDFPPMEPYRLRASTAEPSC